MEKSPGKKEEKSPSKKEEKKETKPEEKSLEEILCLKSLNLKIMKGSFICVIGEFGSGKSSLLSALIGELRYLHKSFIDPNLKKRLDPLFEAELSSESLSQIIDLNKCPIILNESIAYA